MERIEKFVDTYEAAKMIVRNLHQEFSKQFPQKLEDFENQEKFSAALFWRKLAANPELLVGNEKKFLLLLENIVDYNLQNYAPVTSSVICSEMFELLDSDVMLKYAHNAKRSCFEPRFAGLMRHLLIVCFGGISQRSFKYDYFANRLPKLNAKYPYVIKVVCREIENQLKLRRWKMKLQTQLLAQYQNLVAAANGSSKQA